MRQIYTLSIVLMVLVMSTAQAQSKIIKSGLYQTPVLELYTSEGCSSCPPADIWLSEVIKLPRQELDVLALAFHVDYWDYIGWKDPYASPQFTSRQRMLARANRQSSIYTPEFLLNDMEIRGTQNIIDKVRQANKVKPAVQLELTIDKQPATISLQLSNLNSSTNHLNIEFIVFEKHLSSQVNAGENAGRQLHHQHVVRYLSPSLNMKALLNHQIKIKADWNTQNLGIAAIVRSSENVVIQSLFSLI